MSALVLDNAGDIFSAQEIPGPCLHGAPVKDKDALPDMTICAGMGESQERGRGWDREDQRLWVSRGGT